MAKKVKTPKLSDLDLGALLTEIEKAEKEVQIAELELDARKEAAKSAKAEWMVKVSELREKVRTRERLAQEAKRQPLLNPKKDKAAPPADLPGGAVEAKTIGILFDITDVAGQTVATKGTQTIGYIDSDGQCFLLLEPGRAHYLTPTDWAEIVETQSEAPAEWRAFGIDKLATKTTDKDREKLAGNNILTLADLQDRMKQHGTFWFSDLTGIGRAAADRIEDDFNAFILAHG